MTQPHGRWHVATLHLLLLAACAIATSCDRRPALQKAVASGNEAAVMQALEAGADLNATDSRGDTALHVAARLPHGSGMVVMLLRAGADVNASNRQGWTPLHQTLEPATAQTLIDHGGDLRAVDRCGSTPLHTATSGWIMVEPRPGLSASRQAEAESAAAADQRLLDGLRQQVVRVLLENGADPNSPNAVGYTPLHRAAQEGHLEEVRLLLAYGADPLAKDHSGETVLQLATRCGHAAVAQLLQEHANGTTADPPAVQDPSEPDPQVPTRHESSAQASGGRPDSPSVMHGGAAGDEAASTEVELKDLLERLGSKEGPVRAEAALGLAQLGAAAAPAVPALVLALKDEVPSVRYIAATALGQMGSAAREAVPSLIEATRNPSLPLRKCAVRALGQIGPEARAALPALIDALRDKDAYVRMQAAQALGRIRSADRDAASALAQSLGDEDAGVRAWSASSLVRLDPGASAGKAELTRLLHAKDVAVARVAVAAIGEAGPAAADLAPALIGALNTLGADGHMNLVAEALGKLGDAGIHALIDTLKHGDTDARRGAAWCLGWIGPAARAALPALIEAAKDPDPGVRAAVRYAIEKVRQGTK